MASGQPYKARDLYLTDIAFQVDEQFSDREDITIEALKVNPLTKTLSEEQMRALIDIIQTFLPKDIPTMVVNNPRTLELARNLGIRFGEEQ